MRSNSKTKFKQIAFSSMTILMVALLLLSSTTSQVEGAKKAAAATKAAAKAKATTTKPVAITQAIKIPVVTEIPMASTTRSELERLLQDNKQLHEHLNGIEKSIDGPAAKSATATVVDAKDDKHAGKAPNKSVNLKLLTEADMDLMTVNAAMSDKSSVNLPSPQLQREPPSQSHHESAKIDLSQLNNLLPPPDPPAPANTQSQSAGMEPIREEDKLQHDLSSHPNAAEGSSLHAHDSAGTSGDQPKLIGASVGGSVVGIALICGVVGGVMYAHKRKKQKEIKEKDDACDNTNDLKNVSDNDADLE